MDSLQCSAAVTSLLSAAAFCICPSVHFVGWQIYFSTEKSIERKFTLYGKNFNFLDQIRALGFILHLLKIHSIQIE
jgi:hypothetical protein